MARTPDDFCLICLKNYADKKGSHFTPAGISRKVLGERDKEDIYSIDAAGHSIENVKGRSNLANQDPEIKKLPNVEDFIFCSACEKRLGVIEGMCIEKLNILVDRIAEGSESLSTTKSGNKAAAIQIHSNILLLFLYSIAWRQCLQQQLQSDTVIISEDFQEKLREILFNNIYKSIENIQQAQDFKDFPYVQLITTFHRGDITVNGNNPNSRISNPYLFFVSPYDLLIFWDANVNPDFEQTTGYQTSIIDPALVLNTAGAGIVGLVDERIWNFKVKNLMVFEAEKYKYAISSKLAIAKQLPLHIARRLIVAEADKYVILYPDDYPKCLNLALEHLLH